MVILHSLISLTANLLVNMCIEVTELRHLEHLVTELQNRKG